MIDEAKRKAASANVSASATMDTLNDLRKEIDKISVAPVDPNLNNILDGVDQTGEILKKQVTLGTMFLLFFVIYGTE